MPLRAKNRAGLANPNPTFDRSGQDEPASTAVPDNRVRVEWYVTSKPPNKSMIVSLNSPVTTWYTL